MRMGTELHFFPLLERGCLEVELQTDSSHVSYTQLVQSAMGPAQSFLLHSTAGGGSHLAGLFSRCTGGQLKSSLFWSDPWTDYSFLSFAPSRNVTHWATTIAYDLQNATLPCPPLPNKPSRRFCRKLFSFIFQLEFSDVCCPHILYKILQVFVWKNLLFCFCSCQKLEVLEAKKEEKKAFNF